MAKRSTRRTRRASHMERFVLVKPNSSVGRPEAHSVWLTIGCQSFIISDGVETNFEDVEAAKWMRDMLCIALDALVKECTTTPKEEA